MKEFITSAFGLGTAIVDWRATFQLLAMRSAAAGLVWGLVLLFAGGPAGTAFLFIVFGALIGSLFYAPIGILFAGIARIFPPAGIVCLFPLLYIAAGDPVLWTARRFKPDLLPVDKFSIMNFNTVIFVINQELVDTVRDGVTSEVARAGSAAMDRLANFKKG